MKTHYSLCVPELAAALDFYIEVLGGTFILREGSSGHVGIDGNHIVLHEIPSYRWVQIGQEPSGAPIPHFGLITTNDRYAGILRAAQARTCVLIDETRRRAGTKFDHVCFFVSDPGGHPWEIKKYLSAR